MKKMQKAITVLVVLLGLLSGSIAIFAEIKQAMANNQVEITDYRCQKWQQKQNVAQIGAVALTMLVLAQMVINVAGGWICCVPFGKNDNWVLAMVFLVLCWVFFVIASILYVAGTFLNSKEEYYCYGVTPGMFAGGAFSTLLMVASGVFYYIKVSALTSKDKTLNFDL